MTQLKAIWKGEEYSISYINFALNRAMLCNEDMEKNFPVRIDEIEKLVIPPTKDKSKSEK